MTIKDKVLASCKTSYAKYGLKKDELSRLVDLIVASRSLTDASSEEDVTTAINAVEPYVGMMQSAFNRAVSETTEKYKGWVKPSPVVTTQNEVKQQENLTAEAVAKMIADANAANQKVINEAVSAALAPYKAREEKARLATLLQSNEKLKDIPEVFRSRYAINKEEDLDGMVERISNDYTTMKQAMVANGTFVAAPVATSPQTEQEDFAKRLQGFAERNTQQPQK